MKKLLFPLIYFSVAILNPSLVFCRDLEEHAWLYVDGKHIKTSSYACPPNDIFIPTGVSRNNLTRGSHQDIAKWCKNQGCNTVRISFNTLSTNSKQLVYYTLEDNLQNYIDPFVQACRKNELYVILDQHEYFRYYKLKDNKMPAGKPWQQEDIDLWIANWVALADKYKDEPWVIGYELCHEPSNIPAKLMLQSYLKCIKAIREVDKRHVIFLGNHKSSQINYFEKLWAPVNFRPDEPFNQIAFSFHQFPEKYNGTKLNKMIEDIQNKYDVPLFCTEFGIKPGSKLPVEKKKQFQEGIFKLFQTVKIGWTINHLEGKIPVFSSPEFLDLWRAALSEQASYIPVFGNLKENPPAAKINCGIIKDTIQQDEEIAAYAAIKDNNNYTLNYPSNIIVFNFSQEGQLVKSVPIPAKQGIAELRMKNCFNPGRISLTVTSESLKEDTKELQIVRTK